LTFTDCNPGYSNRCCSCLCFVSFVMRLYSIQIVPAQETNQIPVAHLALEMVPPLPLDPLEFLFIQQNLSRVTTADLSGPKVLKAHSTYTRLPYFKEVARVNILILSSPSPLPRCSLQARPKARTLQGPHGAWNSPLLPMVKICRDTHPRIP
jgi:hypothetical protein